MKVIVVSGMDPQEFEHWLNDLPDADIIWIAMPEHVSVEIYDTESKQTIIGAEAAAQLIAIRGKTNV